MCFSISDAMTVIGFLKTFDLDKHFKVRLSSSNIVGFIFPQLK